MSPMSVVKSSSSGNSVRVTLNRPEKLNALNFEMVQELTRIYDSAPKGSFLLLEGEGKAFCAGGDVKRMADAIVEGGFSGYSSDFLTHEYALDLNIASDHHRVCTFWHGAVMGGGVGLGIGSAMRVVSETTIFAMPETKIGFFPDVGMTKNLCDLKGGLPLGLYIGLTGVRLRAADMLYCGLATHFCPQEQLEEAKNEFMLDGRSDV